jgi:hypothetical protein
VNYRKEGIKKDRQSNKGKTVLVVHLRIGFTTSAGYTDEAKREVENMIKYFQRYEERPKQRGRRF